MLNLDKMKQLLEQAAQYKSIKVINRFGIILMRSLIASSVILMLIAIAAKSPEIHGHWIRSKVGDKVYTIRNERGGGTAFAIKAPSGATYIMTNDHVCEVAINEVVTVFNNDGDSIQRRIIEHSSYTDLCLIEGPPGVEGLSVGSEPEVGQIVASVGHPSLIPITLSKGEIIGRTDVGIPIAQILEEEPGMPEDFNPPGFIREKKCKKPKNIIEEVTLQVLIIQMKQKYCLNVTKGAYLTNMVIQSGSSGSPVVNFWGNVIGVVFAGDRAGWGVVVSIDDLNQFLKNY
jgi:S1-C subfamily serine protease